MRRTRLDAIGDKLLRERFWRDGLMTSTIERPIDAFHHELIEEAEGTQSYRLQQLDEVISMFWDARLTPIQQSTIVSRLSGSTAGEIAKSRGVTSAAVYVNEAFAIRKITEAASISPYLGLAEVMASETARGIPFRKRAIRD